jgi:hypothetical protein
MAGCLDERVDGGLWMGGRSLAQQRVPAEASIALAAVRVEDPQIRPPARRPETVPGDGHLHPLADDVTAEPDPGPPGDLQAEAGHFGEGAGHATRQPRRFEDDEQDAGPPGDRRQPPEPVGDTGRAGFVTGPWLDFGDSRRGGEVDDEKIDGPTLDERAGHRQALVERLGGQDDEPLEPDAAGDGLDRI